MFSHLNVWLPYPLPKFVAMPPPPLPNLSPHPIKYFFTIPPLTVLIPNPQKYLLPPIPHCHPPPQQYVLGLVSTFMYDLSTFENLCVPNQSLVCSFTLSDIYCPATKLWKGNVFAGICLSTGEAYLWTHVFSGGGEYLW